MTELESWKECISLGADECGLELIAEAERLQGVREAAVDVIGNASRREDGDYVVSGRAMSRLVSSIEEAKEEWLKRAADRVREQIKEEEAYLAGSKQHLAELEAAISKREDAAR